MNLRNLFRRTSRTRIAQLEAEVAKLSDWNLGWQDYAAYVEAQRDQYDELARDLADELSAAQAEPAHIIADEHLTVLREATSLFPILNSPPNPDFTNWNLLDVDKAQLELPAGTRAA